MKSFQDIRQKYADNVANAAKGGQEADTLIWAMLENAFLMGQDDVLQIIFDDSKRKSLSDLDLQQWDNLQNLN